MRLETEQFESLVVQIVARYFAQNGRLSPSAAELRAFAARLGALVAERGLPRALAPDECGAPGSMAESECAPLAARVLDGAGDALLAEVARQLIKACFYPEFRVCRDSFREATREGACRRQELARVRGRVSGTHCVDCPHWVALPPAAHAAYVAREWRAGPEVFAEHREIYLPEDFRALRQWLHAAARRG